MYGSPVLYGGATFLPPWTNIWLAPITSVTPGHPLKRVEIFTVCPTLSAPTPLETPRVVRDARTTSPAVDPTDSFVCGHGSGCVTTVYRRTIAVRPVVQRGPLDGSSRASQ